MTSETILTAQNTPAGSQFADIIASEKFRAHLDQLFPTRGQRLPEDVRFQMLRFHKNRCVFDVSIKTDDGWQGFIAKVFTIDRSDAFAVMQKIHYGGFGEGAEFAVPRPIAYLPDLRILIEEKVEGRQVKGILLADNPSEHVEAVRRCGAWLARFHASPMRFGNQVEPMPLLGHVQEWADQVVRYDDRLRAKSGLIMEKLRAAVPAEGTFRQCPGHGSYIPSHVLLNSERTMTIDFDEFELVDPARDLAWFLISLERLGLKYEKPRDYYERLTGPFLESYVEAGDKSALRHLAFYKGAEYLHRARHDLYKRDPPVPQWAEMMLDRALSGL